MGVKVKEKVKGSGVWWIFVYHRGQRITRQVGTKAAATKAAQQIEARLTLGGNAFPPEKPPCPTLNEYYETYERTHMAVALKPSSQQSGRCCFERHLLPAVGQKRLDEICRADVEDLIAG